MPLVTSAALKEAVAARALLKPEAAAVEINRMKFIARRPVRALAVTKLWMQRMILAHCWVIASDPAAPFAARLLCKSTYDAMTLGTLEDFEPDDAKMDAQFRALISAGAMTEQDRIDTLAMSDVEVTGSELFGRLLDETDVKNIRAEII